THNARTCDQSPAKPQRKKARRRTRHHFFVDRSSFCRRVGNWSRSLERCARGACKNRCATCRVRRLKIFLRVFFWRNCANAQCFRAHCAARLGKGACIAQPIRDRRESARASRLSAESPASQSWDALSPYIDRLLDISESEREPWLTELAQSQQQ